MESKIRSLIQKLERIKELADREQEAPVGVERKEYCKGIASVSRMVIGHLQNTLDTRYDALECPKCGAEDWRACGC
jgi:hypothetical protein